MTHCFMQGVRFCIQEASADDLSCTCHVFHFASFFFLILEILIHADVHFFNFKHILSLFPQIA